MRHTPLSLLTLAATSDGQQMIRIMVAEASGYQNLRLMTGRSSHGDAMSSWAIGDIPEPLETGGTIGIPTAIPAYHASLDAIMPEVRRLDEKGKAKYMQQMARVCEQVTCPNFVMEWMITSAEAIHHCIAFLLTKQ